MAKYELTDISVVTEYAKETVFDYTGYLIIAEFEDVFDGAEIDAAAIVDIRKDFDGEHTYSVYHKCDSEYFGDDICEHDWEYADSLEELRMVIANLQNTTYSESEMRRMIYEYETV